ncbi:hypothetical protein BJ322DRAFT_601391 [Thelephora terrestris]|uniref:Uncharacterized protein n=1 Tax=Thelephora terrestris TaxID=56493 RepID=A0A9P6L926_9AGAM|nr:hypothetical protein BJ322DRAFT_601391 [Thelephora terrestris]
MELARLLHGDPYRESYRYSQNSTLNLMRGAQVLPYAKTEAWAVKSSAQKPKMVIICIPPWDISKLDLQDFTTRRTFANDELDLTPGEMRTSKAHILWAVAYEACKEANCSHFIVTNYDYWVFGNMSKGYTTASVSTVFERGRAHQRPTLLQLLIYWELASIDFVDWDVPTEADEHIESSASN